MYSVCDTDLSRWVPPFGNLRINARLPAPRSLSQATTSFIACDRQGIHHIHLVTWSYNPAAFCLQDSQRDSNALFLLSLSFNEESIWNSFECNHNPFQSTFSFVRASSTPANRWLNALLLFQIFKEQKTHSEKCCALAETLYFKRIFVNAQVLGGD